MSLQPCRFAGGLRGVLPEGEDANSESAMLGQEEALLVADRLHLVLRPFMLRRLKVDVAADLPQKVLGMACCAFRSRHGALLVGHACQPNWQVSGRASAC